MQLNIKKMFAKKPEAAPATPEIKPPSVGEVGFDVWDLYTKNAFEKYDPDKLKYRKGVNVYNDMMYDDQVKAVMEFKRHAVLSRGWYFDVDQDNEQHQEIADFFNACIENITGSFTDKLLGILNALIHGFSLSEKIYISFDWDGRAWWGVKDIKLRPATSFVSGGFEVDPHGNLLKVKQVYGTQTVEIPLDKIIHFVHQPDVDLHYGESDLKAAYRAYWSKDIAIKFQNIFLERHASGFIWAKITENLSQKQEDDLRSAMNSITAMTSMTVPKAVELNSILPQSTSAFENAIAQHDKAISKSLLVPNLMGITEQGNTGAYAQSQTQIQAFFWTLNAIAKRLAECLNENLFRDLALWNFGTDDFPPFTFQEYSDEQKQGIAKAWAELLSKSAVTKTDSDEAYVRNLMGFPERTEEEIDEANALKDQLKKGAEDKDEEDQDEEEEDLPDNEKFITSLPAIRREFVKQEFASKPWVRRIDFARTKNIMDDSEKKTVDALMSPMEKIRASIEKQTAKVFGDKSGANVNPKDMATVKVPDSAMNEYRKALRDNLNQSLDDGYNIAKSELPVYPTKKQPWKVIRPGMDKTQAEKYLASRTMKLAGKVQADLQAAIDNVLDNAIKYDKTLKATIQALESDPVVDSLLPRIDAAGRAVNVPARLENIARTNISDALNQGRQALFGTPELKGFVVAYEYSAVLDDRTTPVCEACHGRIRKDWADYTPPNHYQALPAGTMITTFRGKKAIEDIKVGDKVLTHNHNFMPVTETMMHETWPEEIVLHFDGGRTLTLTDDHPVLTERGWVCAGDLTTDDAAMSLIGPCEVCGTLTTNERFCSNECKAKGNQKIKTCSHCGKEYRGQNKKYCSHKCMLDAGRRNCEHCGQEIKLKGKKKNNRFCSQVCMGNAMRTLPDKKCLNCGEDLKGQWKKPRSKDRRFCSQKCYMAYKGETSIEETVREYLAVNHIRAQRQYQAGKYFIDLYLPDYKLAIEVDGEYWHGKKAKSEAVIETRERFLLSYGFSVLHLPESAIKSGRYQGKIMEAINAIQATTCKNCEHRKAAM